MERTCRPYFAHSAGLKFIYGPVMAENQHRLFAQLIIPSHTMTISQSIDQDLTHLISIFIVQMRDFLHNGFGIIRQRLHQSAVRGSYKVTVSACGPIIDAIALWKGTINPLSIE
jgi:hypothetical protein